MIRFRCPDCGQMVDAADSEAGKQTKCPGCMHLLTVPSPLYAELCARAQARKDEASAERGRAVEKDIEGADDSPEPGCPEEVLDSDESRFVDLHFDESSLFALTFALCVLAALDRGMRNELHSFVSKLFAGNLIATGLTVVFLLIPFAVGLAFSVYHSFSKRNKSFLEKAMMLFFAVAISSGAGLCAGRRILSEGSGFSLMIFAVWNLVYAGLLILKFEWVTVADDALGGDYVSDRNASVGQIVLGAVTTSIVLLCCHYLFKLHWSIVYSVCVAFTSSVDKAVQKVFGLR